MSELSNITVESVDRGIVSVNSKGKIRTVFLVSELQKKLMRYARKAGIKCGEIFITRSGKYMSRTNIWREMKSLCEEAGVDKKKVFPHNLRHLFARTFYAIKKTSQSLQIS